MIPLCCAVALASAPAAPESLSLRVSGDLDVQELQKQLRLRLPQTELTTGPQTPGEARPKAYVFLSPADGGYALTLVLDDGRAYDRFLTPPEGDAERGVANDLASLIRAVSRGDAAADREGVELPGDESKSESSDDPESASSDEAAADQAEEVQEPPPAEPTSSGLRWGLDAGMGASTALSADRLGASLTGRFRLGAQLLWPSGGTVAAAVNLGVHDDALTIVRAGAEFGGGYAWTIDRLVLPVLGLARIEGAVVQDSPALRRLGSTVDGLPLLWGPVASLRPRWALGESRRVHLGAWLDLSWLFAADEGVGAPRLVEVDEDQSRSLAARVGGPELSLGASLTWTPGSTR